MDKLSEKDQGFIKDNSFDVSNFPSGIYAVYDKDVENKLIQKDAEHKAEIDALKAHINTLSLAALDAISFMSGGDAKASLRDAYDATPEQSLAQHDKQVKIDAIKELMAYLDTGEFKTVQRLVLSQYLEDLHQLKEQ